MADPFRSPPIERPTAEKPGASPRYSRRLQDKLLMVFHAACDSGSLDVAEDVLGLAEQVIRREAATAAPERRRAEMIAVVQAYERLWSLRHPGAATRGPSPQAPLANP